MNKKREIILKLKNSISNKKKFCEREGISYTHFMNILNNGKPVSLEKLLELTKMAQIEVSKPIPDKVTKAKLRELRKRLESSCGGIWPSDKASFSLSGDRYSFSGENFSVERALEHPFLAENKYIDAFRKMVIEKSETWEFVVYSPFSEIDLCLSEFQKKESEWFARYQFFIEKLAPLIQAIVDEANRKLNQ